MPWGESITGTLIGDVEWVNEGFVDAVDDLAEADFHWSPGGSAPSIAFHLWHTARWADRFQARLPTFSEGLRRIEPRTQIWDEERLAEAWGMSGIPGADEGGWGLNDDASAALPLPGRAEILAYAVSAFAAAVEAFSSLRDDELLARTGNFYDDDPWTVLDHFGWYTGHSSRHLGMIEALKGLLGMRGTVTS
ncbi:MAG TPA: DinB family protein [Actinomycetota bacterium]